MKYYLLSIFLITLSCQKKTNTVDINNESPINQTDTVETVSENKIQIDTIPVLISSERKQKSTFVVAKLVSKETNTKGTEVANFELEFYKKNNKTATTNLSIENYIKGSRWRALEGLADEKSTGSSPFVKLRLIHKNPKYIKHDCLFYVKNNQAQLVIKWEGINDLGWGEWLDIHNPDQKIEPDYFYCKTGSFKEIDTTDNEVGMLSYSDSIEFRLKNNKWIQELKSKKSAPYYSKEMNFNEVYK